MDVESFFEIYRFPMHKLDLKSVKLVEFDENDYGREYFHFIGMFQFKPPKAVLENSEEIMNDKELFLKSLNYVDAEASSFIFRKKYTKKIKYKGKYKKWVFNYVFDFNPLNIEDYELDVDAKLMTLYVKGYGSF